MDEVLKSHVANNGRARNSNRYSLQEVEMGLKVTTNAYFSRGGNVSSLDESSTTIVVDLPSDYANESDFFDIYMEVYNHLLLHYNSIGYEEKQVAYVDVNLVSIEGRSAFNVTSKIGKVSNPSTADSHPYDCAFSFFEDSEEYFAGGSLGGEGRCDGSDLSTNASIEIESRVNKTYAENYPLEVPRNAPYLVGFYDAIWTFNVPIERNINDVPLFELDNVLDYYVYYQSSVGVPIITPDCLDHDQLEFYACQAFGYVIEQISPLSQFGFELSEYRLFFRSTPFSSNDNGVDFFGHDNYVEGLLPIFVSDVGGGYGPSDGPVNPDIEYISFGD